MSERVSFERQGFTLIELLVVMAIMISVAALAVVYLPRMNDNIKVASAADRVQGMLVVAKQRAKRDQVRTGVRIVFDSSALATQLQYIQQPDDLSIGQYASASGTPPTATFSSLPAGFAFTQYVVGGDCLILFGEPGAPIPREIATPGAATLTMVANTTPFPASAPTGNPNYRIIRAPRLISGEPAVTLPTDTVIDGGQCQPTNAASTTYDIVFGPSGAVVNGAANSGTTNLICLYIRDVDAANSTAAPSLIAIQGRTGFIGAYPVNTGADPFQFAKDPRGSGM